MAVKRNNSISKQVCARIFWLKNIVIVRVGLVIVRTGGLIVRNCILLSKTQHLLSTNCSLLADCHLLPKHINPSTTSKASASPTPFLLERHDFHPQWRISISLLIAKIKTPPRIELRRDSSITISTPNSRLHCQLQPAVRRFFYKNGFISPLI